MAVFPRVRAYKGVERKVWIAKWKDRGGRWRQKEFARKKDAEHHERGMIREVGLGIHVPDRLTKTFGEACQAWLADNERRWQIGDGMSGYCLNNYRTGVRLYVLPELGGIRLTKLTHALLQEAIDRKAGEGASNAVLGRMIKIIGLVLKFAIRRGWLVANPIAAIPLRLPDRDGERVVPPPMDDLHRILAVLEHRPWGLWQQTHVIRYLLVMLALYAGLRRGEICALQWEDVDFEDEVIRVRHNLSEFDGLKRPKSRAGVRTVPMPPPLKAALLRHAATRPMAGYVLTMGGAFGRSPEGRPVDPGYISRAIWPRLMRAAGLVNENGSPKYSLHALRHAYASILLASGYSLWHVSKLVGHNNTVITEAVYAHLLPTDDTHRRAAASLARTIGAARAASPPPQICKTSAQAHWEELQANALELWREGLSRQAIAQRLGVTDRTVANWLKASLGSGPGPRPPSNPPATAIAPSAPALPAPPAQGTLFD